MELTLPKSTFVREYSVDVMNQTLLLHQMIEGDVNCVVWDAAIVLSKYLEELFKANNNILLGCNAIELGSGLGCVGLTAACLGANVTLTDLPNALPLLELNAKVSKPYLKGQVIVHPLEWGVKTDFGTFDRILLADCVYYEESIGPLVKTLCQLADDKTEILLAQELRDSEKQQRNWNRFLINIKRYFRISQIPLSEQNNEFQSPDILLLRLVKS